MKKITLFLCILSMIAFVGNPAEALGDTITNAEFAQILVNIIGVPVPAGTENLSDEEHFEVLSNILATAGINSFTGLNGSDPISCEIMVAALYQAMGGPDDATYDEKIAYLSQSGFDVPACFGAGGNANRSMVIAILNNPAFSNLVAEAYSPPDTGAGGGGVGAPGVVSEGPATTI